ncbi:MAG TPA: hypothetical protein VH743_09320 [Beijerinckiaceae bacterium]|jgi:hypothetical protein
MIAYNVFQSREKGIYCAVPEDQPVPAFIVGESWEFSEKCGEDHLPKSAPESIRFGGFFIFHPFSIEKLAA